MNLFIPDIGTLLKLEEDWTFTLYLESRNMTLFNKIEGSTVNMPFHQIKPGLIKNKIVELPKGLIVKVDRIYIRKGLSQYSSITFTVPKPKTKKEKEEMPFNIEYGGCKFWVKLHECNGTQFSTVFKNPETTLLFQKIYIEIEKDASTKFGVEKCTKMLAQINRLLGAGQNINNFSTDLRYDQFLNHLIHKIKEDSFLSDYLTVWLKTEMRDYKIRQLV